MKKEEFNEIMEYIRENIDGTIFEQKTYVVGGAVRDLVMGNEIKDVDIVVELPQGGIRLGEHFNMLEIIGNVVTYQTYGTVMFHFKKFPEHDIECVMTRGEKYTDEGSRNPTVTFADLNEDGFRRDLTINSLYYDISNGEIVDPTGCGIQDIQEGLLRVPMELVSIDKTDQTFIDDPLRILRVIRFQTRYSFEISEPTLESMKRNVDRLSIITKERINTELCKILMSKYAVDGIRLIHEIGAMKYVIPELEECVGLEQNAYHFGDVWVHSLAVLETDCKLFEPDIICRLAALLHDIGKIKCKTVKDGKVHFYDHEYVGVEIVETILKRLKFDNKTIEEVCFIVKNHMRTKRFQNDCRKMNDKSFNKITYICKDMERFERLCRVIECDNLSHEKSHCITGQYEVFMSCVKEFNMFGYKLPINGNDVMTELGIEPGPDVKEVLKIVLNNVFSNPELNRVSCLKIVKQAYKTIKSR